MVIPFQEEKDDNYEEEAEVADVFDSDFDEDVSNCFMDLKMKSICQICFLILLHFGYQEPEPDDEVENDEDDRLTSIN